MAKSAALNIGVAEFADELHRLRAAELTWIQRQLKVRNGAQASVVAQSMRTMLVRAPEELTERILHDALHHGVLSTAMTCELSEEELGALLRADPARLGFLTDRQIHVCLQDVGSFGFTTPVRVAVWSAMVTTAHPGSVAALGWLVAEAPGSLSPEGSSALRQLWEQVLMRHPALPDEPQSLERLVEVVTRLRNAAGPIGVTTSDDQSADGWAGSGEESADVGGGQRSWYHNGHRHGNEVSPEDLSDIIAFSDAVTAAHALVRDHVLPDLVASVHDGRLPPDGALIGVGRLSDDLTALFEKVAAVTQEGLPSTLDEARLRLDELSAAMENLGQLIRIRRLVSLRAPDYVAGEARLVAELAASVDADTDAAVLAGLDALLTAIEIGSRDPQRVTELARTVQAGLPDASVLLHVVRDLALEGDDVSPTPDTPPDGDGGIGPGPVQSAPAADAEGEGPATTTAMAPAGELAPAITVTLAEVLARMQLTIPEPSSAVEQPGQHVLDGPADAATDPRTPLDVEAMHVGLLQDGQFALASWLMHAQAAPVAVVAAHRLAAHAAAMRSSAGSNAAAFVDTVRQLDADALNDRPDMQMLIYAASVRAGLLSPTAGAAGPLRDLTTSVVKAGPAVEELTEALLNAIYSGVYLTARSADAVAEAAGAEAGHEDLTRAARELLLSGPSRTIRYAAATELWQSWMAASGFLGTPLTIVASGSRDLDDLGAVRDRVRELRSKSTLEATLDYDTRRSSSVKRRSRIEARARSKILEWTDGVTDLLARWVEATENLTRPAAAGTWMADPMAELRARVNTIREPALEQLAALAHTGQPARDAAIQAGLALLSESLELLDGKTALHGAELSAERLVHGQLALVPQLPIAPSLEPLREVTVFDIEVAVDTLSDGEAGWVRAFDRRAAQHDQVGTQILIDVVRSADASLAQRLSVARDRAVADSASRLDQLAGGVVTRIDADRRYGRLTADEWADLSSRVREFMSGTRGVRRDYDVMLTQVARIEEDRAARVQAAVDGARRQLTESDAAAGPAARVASRIDEGDLTTANEYLETIRGGRELPGPREEVDNLRRFHPVFPNLFAGSAGSSPTTVALSELKRAIEEGRNPAAGPLTAALSGAGIDLSLIGRPRAASGSIGQWMALAQEGSLDARLGNVKAVLEQLGFFVDGANTPTGRRGQSAKRSSWMHLTSVRATAGNALIPAFGSAISPSGDTLRLLAVWRSPTASELIELLRNEPTDHSVVVLYFGTLDADARRELATEFRSGGGGGRRLPVTAVVDEAAFAYLVSQPEPSRDTTMAITLPFTSATPFTPDVAGLVPQEMFYGRAEERDKVVDMMGSCIVYGGRQLGKSALLRAAAREFDDNVSRHAVYLSIYRVGQDVPADAVWSALWPILAEKGVVAGDAPPGEVAPTLMGRVATWIAARPGRQLLLLLDESDSFLDADAAEGRFTNVTQFKELMERTSRSVKVVFAGLHQTARFERLANHPLAHFGDPVCVGPLAPQAAYDLLTNPLQALGYRFGELDHAPRVLALANNQPALIQLFGAQLLRNLQRVALAADAPPQNVTDDDVEAVWADDALRAAFRKRFDWTLNLDLRYKVIAYSVAFHAHTSGAGSALSPAALRVECEQWWPQGFAAENVRSGEFRALLDECVDLGVLSYANGGYRLRTPNVLDLLGSRDEVDEFLEQAESMPLPQSFDGSLLRPAFGTGPTRGPLTSQQIADLLSPRSQVRMIAGSTALTIERCVRAMRDEHDNAVSSSRRVQLREAAPATLQHECQQATMLAAGGHAVVVVDLKAAMPKAAWNTWRTARELIAAHSGGTLGIVLVTSPKQAALWPTVADESDASSGLTGLRRYDRTDLRLWLTDTTLPFQDDASRNELLSVSGGWPMNVNKVAEDLSRDQNGDARVDPLGGLRAHLADPQRANELVAASGARADGVLSEAWTFLVREFAAERVEQQTIVDYLRLHAESEDSGAAVLGESQLAEHGYRSMADVVDVLRTLGLLITSADGGHLLVEPVMAAATQASVR
ncbi:hypothetical protein Cs7R123_31840 [Catellatospora sp. TT07R-123]|nr:hypothetical protein Cs7R123_31840 [Catellatospora sp. TT07R-123]